MSAKIDCIFNWSGGKDSALALYKCLQNPQLNIRFLVTTINDRFDRISMHGVRKTLLVKQAESIGIPLYEIRLPEMPDMKTYDKAMAHHLKKLKQEEISHSIFGDIFLEDLKKYREEKLQKEGLKAIFPLWQQNTTALVNEFISLGFKTITVCVKEDLKAQLGKVIDKTFLEELPKNVDPCGENGEFHTYAFDGPIFKNPIKFELGEQVFKTYTQPKNPDDTCFTKEKETTNPGFWYQDLIEVEVEI